MRRVRELVRKSIKVLYLVRVSAWRRGLRHRVAAAVEHDPVTFGADFRSVLDVGAHRGQFALFAGWRFPGTKLYCFEPLPDARGKLESVLADQPESSTFPLALGSRSGRVTMHVSRRDDSSSILRPTERQTAAFPGTDEAAQEEVELARLDDVLAGGGPLPRPCLLKIDVQGAELEVLAGARRTLENVDELLVECSFVELYRGQALAAQVIADICTRGFDLSGVYGVVRDVRRRCLQADLLFSRSAEARGTVAELPG